MGKFDYNELYTLLYNMQEAKSMSELAEKIYCSISKVSKMIKWYENHLKIQLFVRGSEQILSEDGYKLLLQIEGPLKELNHITKIEHNIVGIDENLIEDQIDYVYELEKRFNNTLNLIEQYNTGKLDKIVVSSDFDSDFEYENKKLITQKVLYKICHKEYMGSKLYANPNGCPITKRLKREEIVVDEYLTQSLAICKMVRQKNGIGYTFSVETLDSSEIEISKCEDLTISFFLYTKY